MSWPASEWAENGFFYGAEKGSLCSLLPSKAGLVLAVLENAASSLSALVLMTNMSLIIPSLLIPPASPSNSLDLLLEGRRVLPALFSTCANAQQMSVSPWGSSLGPKPAMCWAGGAGSAAEAGEVKVHLQGKTRCTLPAERALNTSPTRLLPHIPSGFLAGSAAGESSPSHSCRGGAGAKLQAEL